MEGVLFNALVKIGAVSQDNADDPTKVTFFWHSSVIFTPHILVPG